MKPYSPEAGKGGSTAIIEILTADSLAIQAKDLFGINTAQVADIAGVSRAMFHDHLSSKKAICSMDSYQRLAEITSAVKGVVKRDIKPGLKSILVDGKTLLAYLRDKQTTTETIVSVCQRIDTKLLQMEIKSPSMEAQKQAVRDNSILS